MADVKLYGIPLSTYVRTARLALEEKGVAYDNIPIPPGTPDIAPHHPFGRVPGFEHGGFKLYETSAICRYVDEVFPGPAIAPKEPKARALMEQWISAISCYYDSTVTRVVIFERLVAPMFGNPTNEQRIKENLDVVGKRLDILNGALSGRKFLAGDSISIADLFLLPIMFYLELTPEKSLLAACPNIRRWYDSMASRPSFAKTVPQFPPKR
jgi:glutathione S-transferase